MSQACTETTNTECQTASVCGEGKGDGVDTYTSVAATTTSDAVCKPETTCISGEEYAQVTATDDRNRVCTTIDPCPEGKFGILTRNWREQRPTNAKVRPVQKGTVLQRFHASKVP